MTVVGRLAVNRAAEIQLINDVRRLEAEHLVDRANDLRIRNGGRAEGLNVDADRVRMSDGVGELHFALRSELGSHDVLRDPAAHVCGAAIHLRRVFAGERATAVTAHAAVGVHDDLATSQTSVALRSTDDETARGVDEKLSLVREQASRENLLDDVLDAELFDLGVFDIFRMLRGDDDVGDRDGLAVLINDGNLRLRIGAQPRRFAALANLGQLTTETMREHDRRGHQLGSFVARVTEHQTLIASTLLRGLLAFGLLGVHALSDVGRLLRHDDIDEHLIRVEHVVIVHVADFADGFARDGDEIELGLGGDFTADNGDVRLHIGFAGDAAELVLSQTGVEDGIGNGICDFVRVALADGLGRKDVTVAHVYFRQCLQWSPMTY